jgi:putative ABC transport system permease protein
MFALPIAIPPSAFVVLPIVAIIVGLLSSLVALRRAIAVDPSSAFAAAA